MRRGVSLVTPLQIAIVYGTSEAMAAVGTLVVVCVSKGILINCDIKYHLGDGLNAE